MNNKISNPKTEVPATEQMNDCNYLTSILEIEKNMSVNLTIALNETSNEELYNKLFESFKLVKEAQRNLYELSFKKGWYTLEKAEDTKIAEKYNECHSKINELIKQ